MLVEIVIIHVPGVLTGDLKTRDRFLVLEFETYSLGVVAQNFNVGHLEANPSLVAACENLGSLLRSLCSGSAGLVAVQSSTKTCQTNSQVNRSKGLALGCFGRVLAGALT